MTVSTLSVQIITSFAELWALGPEWRALETRCATDLPFQMWEWSTSWWSHLHEDRSAVRDALRVCVVRASSGEVLGIAPLMLTERPSRGPLRIRVLQFIGADPNITELRLMLCDPLFERDCYQALMRYLMSPAQQWDWVAWEARGPDIGTALGMRDPLVGVEERSTFILDLPSTWDEFKKGLGRNIKESLRHCYNSLKRDELTFRLEVLTGPEEIVSALPEFFRLHTARANFKGALRHTDVFASLRAREFLVEVCRRLATRGAAHVFQLWVDDQLVSTRIGFRLGDALYLYYSGWDPDYGRYAVMTTLLAEVIQYAIAQGLGCVNLSTGKDVSKTRWGTREVCYAGGRQISPRLNARAVHFVYDRAVRARTNKVARVLMPAFLVRGSPTRAALTPEGGTSHVLEWGDPSKMGGVAAAVATIAAADLLDGMLHLPPLFSG